MRIYLYGQSALGVLRHLRCIHDERVLEAPSRVRALSGAVSGSRGLAGLSMEAERLLAHAGERVHVLVGDKVQAGVRGRVHAHLWTGPLPSGAFLRLAEDLFLSSPSFVFLQLARELEFVDLVRLGMELCGGYSLPERHTPFVPRSIDETEYEIEPVTTARKVQALCDAAKAAHGMKAARAAARWLLDYAASPMESAVYMMLCLPKRLGGYALPQPVLNPKVTVSTAHGKRNRYPDLYWKGRSVDVEYQSDKDHSGEWKRYRDSKRQVQLATNKIAVLPLTWAQTQSADDFHEFARGLQRLLGVRLRGADARWERRRSQLRRALLSPRGA